MRSRSKASPASATSDAPEDRTRHGNAADIEAACDIAATRLRQGVCSRMPLRRRTDVLIRFSELIAKSRDILAVLDTMEMGKPIAEMCAKPGPRRSPKCLSSGWSTRRRRRLNSPES
ncbi:aldehyde dehydrogenase family protein [Ensifer sp. Root423]